MRRSSIIKGRGSPAPTWPRWRSGRNGGSPLGLLEQAERKGLFLVPLDKVVEKVAG